MNHTKSDCGIPFLHVSAPQAIALAFDSGALTCGIGLLSLGYLYASWLAWPTAVGCSGWRVESRWRTRHRGLARVALARYGAHVCMGRACMTKIVGPSRVDAIDSFRSVRNCETFMTIIGDADGYCHTRS